LNFSTVGRNCTQEQREEYCHWDLGSGERKKLRDEVKHKFPELDCTIGGEISIDIYPMGHDKSQAITFIRDRHGISPISFFGDKLHHGGNDFPVYSVLNTKDRRRYAIPLDIVVPVKEWKETMKKLKNI
jgi:phosphomannomutase